MELDISVNKKNLFTNLLHKVGKVDGRNNKFISLKSNELTDEVWEEIVRYNLNPESPYLLYFAGSSTGNNVEVKVVNKSA